MSDSRPELARFFELAHRAKRADEELRVDISDREYEDVLDHVLAHSELRSDFTEAFVKIVYDPSLGPLELVEYCMHYLRWQEVEACFRSRLENESSERVRFVLRRLLRAFAEDWPDADIYRRFQKAADDASGD